MLSLLLLSWLDRLVLNISKEYCVRTRFWVWFLLLLLLLLLSCYGTNLCTCLAVILVRRPYGIGDRVQVGNIESEASLHGALPWVVDNVTLFETTLVYLPTNERASLSNGSLANSRIINWARRCVCGQRRKWLRPTCFTYLTISSRQHLRRSPQAQFHIFLQFPLNTSYQKLVLFKRAVEEYMRARPRVS